MEVKKRGRPRKYPNGRQRHCRICGKLCYGKHCQDCWYSNKFSKKIFVKKVEEVN